MAPINLKPIVHAVTLRAGSALARRRNPTSHPPASSAAVYACGDRHSGLPWNCGIRGYVCAATVRMDTALRRGQVHADRVAVRCGSAGAPPAGVGAGAGNPRHSGHQVVPLPVASATGPAGSPGFAHLHCNQSSINSCFPNDITIEEPELVYVRVLIVPIEGLPETEWLVLEDFFRQRLSPCPST